MWPCVHRTGGRSERDQRGGREARVKAPLCSLLVQPPHVQPLASLCGGSGAARVALDAALVVLRGGHR